MSTHDDDLREYEFEAVRPTGTTVPHLDVEPRDRPPLPPSVRFGVSRDGALRWIGRAHV